MKSKRERRSKLFSLFMVMVMVVSLTSTLLLLNANALNSSMKVSSSSTVSSSAPKSLSAGQVCTWKTVSDSSNGVFNMSYNAIGGTINPSTNLIDSTPANSGLTFDDTFKSDFGFVTSGSGIPFKIDSTSETATLTGSNTYSYTGVGFRVTFDTSANTVKYTIDASALKTTNATTALDVTSVSFNSLAFGIQIGDTTTAATYRTNASSSFAETTSCTAKFNATKDNTYYYAPSSTTTYTNTAGSSDWVETSLAKAVVKFSGTTIDTVSSIQLYTDDTKYFDFNTSTGVTIDSVNSTTTDWFYGITSGKYFSETVQIPAGFVIDVHFDFSTHKVYASIKSGTMSLKVTTPGTTQFTITPPPPTATSTSVTLTAGGTSTTYAGTMTAFTDANNWTLQYSSGSDSGTVQLSKDSTSVSTLTIKHNGQWITGRSDSGSVTQALDAYGSLNLGQAEPSSKELAITKKASAATVAAGTQVSYTVTATYTGTDAIPYFTFSDTMFGNMDAGSLKVFLDDVATTNYSMSSSNILTVTPNSISETSTPVVKLIYSVTFNNFGTYTNTVTGVAYPVESTQYSSNHTVYSAINTSSSSATNDSSKSYTAPKLLATSSQLSGSASATVTVINPIQPSPSPTPSPSPSPSPSSSPSPSPSPSQQPSPSPSPSQGVAGEQEKTSPSPSQNPSPSADKGVAGDSDKLPQTGGISTSTTLGLIGLALVATGGGIFIVFGKSRKHS